VKSVDLVNNDKSYKLLKQYCYVCHMPNSKDNMIAPPLFRVKEHYFPVYENKADFVEAITNWVQKPNEKNVLMPGAVRKFNLMPPQSYISKDTLKLIAEYIFNNELEKPGFFGNMHDNSGERKGQNQNHVELKLNNGKKWKVSPEVLNTMKNVKDLTNSFDGKTIEDYNKFGIDIFNKAKIILLNKDNSGQTWDQLHSYFNSMENDMHKMMSVSNIEDAKILKESIDNNISKFNQLFE